MDALYSPEIWIAFFTLTALELVLGIDNIIFISILVDKLPKEKQELARRIGLFLAMFMRIALLLLLSWIVGLTEPVLTAILAEVPDCFLEQAAADKDGGALNNVQAHRGAYVNYFVARLAERGRWLQGVIDARA